MKLFLFCTFFVSQGLFGEQPYILMHLGGRLGNQMFQVAAALSLAEDYGARVIIPDLECRTGEGIPLNRKIFFHSISSEHPFPRPSFVFKEHHHFCFQPIPYQPYIEIVGYFQSEKYFKHNKDKVLAFFEPTAEIKEYLLDKYGEILEHPNTVGIHLRAYKLENLEIEKCFPFLKAEYFINAAELFSDDALFVFFSDRIEWAKEEMKNFERPHIFIENETYYHDLYLMSFCKHQIISPSSFSWWAAYLNKNPDKLVVAPDPWFNPDSHHDSSNVIPEGWFKMSWEKEVHYRKGDGSSKKVDFY